MSNRHLVDQLADVRQELKRLQEEELILKSKLELDGADLCGDEWEAKVVRSTRFILDRDQLEKAFGKDCLDKFTRASKSTSVKLWRKVIRPDYHQNLQEDLQDSVPF